MAKASPSAIGGCLSESLAGEAARATGGLDLKVPFRLFQQASHLLNSSIRSDKWHELLLRVTGLVNLFSLD
jgi:hypothetical protein